MVNGAVPEFPASLFGDSRLRTRICLKGQARKGIKGLAGRHPGLCRHFNRKEKSDVDHC